MAKTKEKTRRGKGQQSVQSGQLGALKVSDVARQLSCCEATVRAYINAGKLEASRPGKRNIVTQKNVDDFLLKYRVVKPEVSAS